MRRLPGVMQVASVAAMFRVSLVTAVVCLVTAAPGAAQTQSLEAQSLAAQAQRLAEQAQRLADQAEGPSDQARTPSDETENLPAQARSLFEEARDLADRASTFSARARSQPLNLPDGPTLDGFDLSRLSNVSNGWFETFHVQETEPLSSVLEDGRVGPETSMLVIETGDGPLALVRDQMASHHIAEGRAGGRDWMATF